MGLHPDKIEAVRQWTSDPCGAVGDMDADDRSYWERVDSKRYEHYAPWLRETMGFHNYPGKAVLEVGCGMGTDLMQFARGGSIVHGLDLTPQHLDLTSRRFKAFDMPVNLVRGDAENLPFASETFDVVYSFGVLHHVPHIDLALNEILRVLKRGGALIVAVYNLYSLPTIWMMAVRGLLQGQLFKNDIKTFLSTVETRQLEDSATPLVKLYTPGSLRKTLANFEVVKIVKKHASSPVEPSDGLAKASLKKLVGLPLVNNPIQSLWGWYLIAFARKPHDRDL